MQPKSFAHRLILNFTFVVFFGFLAVYFLFNSLMDNHIRSEAEAELDREIMTVTETEIVPQFRATPWGHVDILWGTPVRTTREILNVNTIIVGDDGRVLLTNPFISSEEEDISRVEALVGYFNAHKGQFQESGKMMRVNHEGHTFYMRATPHYLAQSGRLFPIYVLMYTDITPAMNLKMSMNHTLLILLAVSGILTLGSSILLASRFKKSIESISAHAQIIGSGNFERASGNLKYLEFDGLQGRMNQMAAMLGAYEAQQKQFFQNASHELRTPLMSIQGYAEGLQLDVFEGPVAAEVILEESKKMADLINDILYLSKLGTEGNSGGEHERLDVGLIVGDALKRVEVLADTAGIQLVCNLVDDLKILGNRDRLERAILNILTNALRYANTTITVECQQLGDSIQVAISNDGPPILSADLSHIFERFYKGDGGNTGLGLAITKEIIQEMGGSIFAENLDKRVRFLVVLPT
ncbi:MAG: HAMP domain-containing histidine kinase [Turicibacter sp.]|nr:HAMP domain-containing histidine kinase [Turicibacter sp.]